MSIVLSGDGLDGPGSRFVCQEKLWACVCMFLPALCWVSQREDYRGPPTWASPSGEWTSLEAVGRGREGERQSRKQVCKLSSPRH